MGSPHQIFIQIDLMRAGKGNRNLNTRVVHPQAVIILKVPPNIARRSMQAKQASEGPRVLASTKLSPANVRLPSSPSWGSEDSSGRRHHNLSSPNLSSKESSSGE